MYNHTLGVQEAGHLTSSDGWGAVTAALTRAESQGIDPASMLRESWSERQRERGCLAPDLMEVLDYRKG